MLCCPGRCGRLGDGSPPIPQLLVLSDSEGRDRLPPVPTPPPPRATFAMPVCGPVTCPLLALTLGFSRVILREGTLCIGDSEPVSPREKQLTPGPV